MAYTAGLELTLDGSATVYSERYGEFFHNRFGAKTQARHVFLEGSMIRTHATWRVLEIGFGLGLNFLTTLQEANARGRALDYRAFELDPQPRDLLEKIGRDEPAAEVVFSGFGGVHRRGRFFSLERGFGGLPHR